MMDWMSNGFGVFIVLMVSHLPGGTGQVRKSSILFEPIGFNDTIILKNFEFQRDEFRNTAVEPCEDFYGYVCGRESTFDYPPTVMKKPEWEKLMHKQLRGLIEKPISVYEKPLIAMVKTQYRMCMNNESRETDGFATLKGLLKEYMHEWPMLMDNSEWNPENLTLLEPQKYHPSLFSIRVVDSKIRIDRYDISAYGGYLSNLKFAPRLKDRHKYSDLINTMMEAAGLKSETSSEHFGMDLRKVMNFREGLHTIAMFESPEQAREIQYTVMTARQLQRLFELHLPKTFLGRVNWMAFLRYLFKEVPNVEIDELTVIDVEETYMKNLVNLMKEYDARTLANHIKLHLFETYAGETTMKMKELSISLAKAAYEASEPEEVNSCFNQPYILRAANYLYLEEWFPQHSRDKAQEMIEDIKRALIGHIKNTKMFSNELQKKTVQDEVRRVTVIIGSEHKYFRYSFLQPIYQYEFSTNHLEFLINAQRAFKRYEYFAIDTPETLLLTSMPVLQSEPFVSIKDARIELPMGYLHRASLSPTLPKTYSFATLGQEISLLMNEIIIRRGFESLEFDPAQSWYNHIPTAYFNTRINCFKAQYGLNREKESSRGTSLSKRHHNIALEYKIYDNTAFDTLYSAYEETNKETESTDEAFLINWANRFCSYWNKFADNSDRRWFNHLTPKNMRLNKIILHSAGFQDAFNCSVETPEYYERCKFWD